MEFKVGDTVVYPHHGAAVIEAIEQREMGGETLEYLVLQIHQSDLVVRVPSKNAETVGVRDVVGEAGRRDQGKGLSAGEKRMLAKARQVLVGELALAEIKDEAKANELLAEVDATIVRHRLQGGDDTPEPKHPQPIIDEDDTDLDDLNFDD